ncbi:MAG: hypothetical protein R2705_17230 [Ilumatobacteraceae bacterium]
MPTASSVFFGGGTPSLLDAESIARIIASIERRPGAEVTVECNPDTVSFEKLAGYAAGGVERLSFGVQSMVDHVLVALGRSHDLDNVRFRRAQRRAGIDRLNPRPDLRRRGESVDDWRRTIEEVVSLGVGHVSAYALTVEAGTPLAEDPSRYPDDDDQADKYDLADEVLTGPDSPTTRSPNWPAPARSAATTSSTGPRATTTAPGAQPIPTSTVDGGGRCAVRSDTWSGPGRPRHRTGRGIPR